MAKEKRNESIVTLTFNAKSGMLRQVAQDEGKEKSVEKSKESNQ